MSKSTAITPKTYNGYLILPLMFPATPTYMSSQETNHYLYIHRHSSKIPNLLQDACSLFLANIPVDTSVAHIRALFSNIGGGLVESVSFMEENTPSTISINIASGDTRKRKLPNDTSKAPVKPAPIQNLRDRHLHKPGSNAIVVFVDRKSCNAAFVAAEKCCGSRRIIWGEGVRGVPALGLQRYIDHHRARYPDPNDLTAMVESFMTEFSELEKSKHAMTKRQQEPDEHGFVTVTRGIKRDAPATQEGARAAMEAKKRKGTELNGFYRFQIREERKIRQQEILAEFERNKMLVDERKGLRKFQPI